MFHGVVPRFFKLHGVLSRVQTSIRDKTDVLSDVFQLLKLWCKMIIFIPEMQNSIRDKTDMVLFIFIKYPKNNNYGVLSRISIVPRFIFKKSMW